MCIAQSVVMEVSPLPLIYGMHIMQIPSRLFIISFYVLPCIDCFSCNLNLNTHLLWFLGTSLESPPPSPGCMFWCTSLESTPPQGLMFSFPSARKYGLIPPPFLGTSITHTNSDLCSLSLSLVSQILLAMAFVSLSLWAPTDI